GRPGRDRLSRGSRVGRPGAGRPPRSRLPSVGATPGVTSFTLTGRPPGGLRSASPMRMPGDKSISHRALLLAARAEGVSRSAGLSDGDDVRRTLEAIQALGARVSEDETGALRVVGRQLHRPLAPIFA